MQPEVPRLTGGLPGRLIIVEGIDGKSVDLPDLATKLKTYCACGGTSKNNAIILQGDHRDKVKKVLVGYGFPEASIELH